MKVTKQFFGNANSLNKGYTVSNNEKRVENDRLSKIEIAKYSYESGLLPAPELFQIYEEIKPGTLEHLLELAKKEQHYIHQLNFLKLKLYQRMRLIGQCFGLIMILLLCYTGLQMHTNWLNTLIFIASSSVIAFLPLILYTKLKLAHSSFSVNSAKHNR